MKPELYTDEEWRRMSPAQQQQAAAWWAGLTDQQRNEYRRNKTPYSGPPPNSLPQNRPGQQIPSVGGGLPGMPSDPTSNASQSMPKPGVDGPGGGGTQVGGSAGGGGGWGWLPSVGRWALDNADWLIPTGLGVWGAVEGHQQDQRAQGMEDRAIQFRERQYADMEPVRKAAMERLENAARPDLSHITYDAGNPYSAARRIPSVGSGAPTGPAVGRRVPRANDGTAPYDPRHTFEGQPGVTLPRKGPNYDTAVMGGPEPRGIPAVGGSVPAGAEPGHTPAQRRPATRRRMY